jgi:hypothetical protein
MLSNATENEFGVHVKTIFFLELPFLHGRGGVLWTAAKPRRKQGSKRKGRGEKECLCKTNTTINQEGEGEWGLKGGGRQDIRSREVQDSRQ